MQDIFEEDYYIQLVNNATSAATSQMNEEVINCLHNLVYLYLLDGNHIDVDNTIFYICNLIDFLLKNPIYKKYITNFLNEYELYSKHVENEVNEITENIKKKIPNHYEYSFYPRYPLKRESGLDYIQENYEPLVESFKINYRNTTINHAIIATTINIYLDILTNKMNYIKFQIVKTELTNKFSVKSNSTYLLDFVNQYYMLDYISIQKELNYWLNKHTLLVFDSAIDFVYESPSKHYYAIYNSKNNIQIELNSNKYYDFYSLKKGHPNIKNVYSLMYKYYRHLVPHYEYELPISVIDECIKNKDEKLWNSLCTKKNLFGQLLKLPTRISSFI